MGRHASQHTSNGFVRLVLVLGLTLLSLPFLASPASAAVIGGFEIDGNKTVESAIDWNSPIVGTQPVTVDPIVGDPTVFSGGSKEINPSGWSDDTNAQAPAKSDLGAIYSWSQIYQGDLWAYFGFERESNSGTTYYSLELNQLLNHTNTHGVSVPTRSDGDVIFNIEQQGNGTFSFLGGYIYDGGYDFNSPPDIPAGNVAGATSADGLFGEIALNLTELLGIEPGCPPAVDFSTMSIRTRSSSSITSELKDYTAPVTFQTPSTCGSFSINKTVDGNAPGDATFMISPDPTPGSAAAHLVVTTGADGNFTMSQAQPGTYEVQELAPPAGYLLPVDATQPLTIVSGQAASPLNFNDVLGDVFFTKGYEGTAPTQTGATFTLTRTDQWVYDTNPAGGIDAPSLGAYADTSTTVTDNGLNDADNTIGEISVTGLYGGHYTLVEASAPAGWEPAGTNTQQAFNIGPTDAAAERSKNLDPEGAATTFNNVLRTVEIVVIKRRTVPGVPSDNELLPGVTFQLYTDDGDHVDELGGQDALVSAQDTDANGEIHWTGLSWQNDYWLREVKEPGYEIGLTPNPTLIDLDQSNPPTTNGTSTVINVNNPREEVSIHLTKTGGDETQNDTLNGGAFDLYREADGETGLTAGDTKVNTTSVGLTDSELSFSSADYQIPWGYTYYIVEVTAPAGYGFMTPNPIEINPTEADANTTVELQATDPRLPIKLTLVKIVDNGTTDGTATVEDFPLTADGPTTVTGVSGTSDVTAVSVDAGTYHLSEAAGPQGYTASDWSCVGNDDTATDGELDLALGDDVTCTITNTAVAGTFDVVKSSDPVSGSTVKPGDVVTYTVTVLKTGGVDSTNVVVTDNMAAVLAHADLVAGSITTSSGTAVLTGTNLVWTIPVLSDVETITYQVRIQTDEDDYGITIVNHVTSDGSATCPVNPAVESKKCTTNHHTVELLPEEVIPPKAPRPPVVEPREQLPNTGVSSQTELLGLMGGVALVLGGWLMIAGRRTAKVRAPHTGA